MLAPRRPEARAVGEAPQGRTGQPTLVSSLDSASPADVGEGMPLDPQVQALLDQIAGMGLPPFEQQSVAEARAAIAAFSAASGDREPIARVENRTIPGPQGEIPVRIYTPDASAPL